MNKGSNIELFKSIKKQNKVFVGYKRLELLFDDGKFDELDPFIKSGKDYAGVFCGVGLINGQLTYAFAQSSDRDDGAISQASLYKIKKVYNLALKTGLPIIGIYDSVGAKLEEGNAMLSSYGKVFELSSNLSGVAPQISIILGPCIGTSAMLAGLSDFIIMQKSACLGINTDGTDSSYKFAENGICDIIANDEQEAILYAKEILNLLPANNLEQLPINKNSVNNYSIANKINSEDGQNNIIKIIESICDKESFIEFLPNFGKSIITGLASLGGGTVAIIACNRCYNKGILDADSCLKAEKLIQFSNSFSIPIINLVDSEGFSSLKEAVKLSKSYLNATTAKITVIVGKAYGPVYISFGSSQSNSDVVLAWPDALISALNPKTETEILYHDCLKQNKNPLLKRYELEQMYKEDMASAFEAASNGFIDEIIEPNETRKKLFLYLDIFMSKRVIKYPKKH